VLPLKTVVSEISAAFTRIRLYFELPIVPCFLPFLELSLAIGTFHHSDHLLFFLNQAKTFLFGSGSILASTTRQFATQFPF